MVGESLTFPPISIHITFIFDQNHILIFFIHLKPEVEAIGAGGKDRGGSSPPSLSQGEGRGLLSR